MKEITFGTLLAVFEEIFGRFLFWAIAAVAILVTVAYLYVLIRDHNVSWKKFLLAQLSMPFGAVAAVWFVLLVTHSSLSDIGGPIDAVILLTIATLGAIGAAVLVYTLQSLLKRGQEYP